MAEPWFDEATFGTVCGVAGAVFGILAGAWGGLAGWLAPQGRARALIWTTWAAFLVAGLAVLGLGLYALIVGQPRYIWSGLCYFGLLVTGLIGGGFFVLRQRYAPAEQRRLLAE